MECIRMKWNDFALNVPSVKLQYFAVFSPSRWLMLQRKKMKKMLSEAISKCEFLSLKWITPPKSGRGPYSEVVQYRDNPWQGRSKLQSHGRSPKISLIYELGHCLTYQILS